MPRKKTIRRPHSGRMVCKSTTACEAELTHCTLTKAQILLKSIFTKNTIIPFFVWTTILLIVELKTRIQHELLVCRTTGFIDRFCLALQDGHQGLRTPSLVFVIDNTKTLFRPWLLHRQSMRSSYHIDGNEMTTFSTIIFAPPR